MSSIQAASDGSVDGVHGEFHVAFCIDKKYFRSMGATVASLVYNNPQLKFVVHILAFEVDVDEQRRLDNLQSMQNVRVLVHRIDPAQFSQFSRFIASSYYSPVIFARLLIPMVLRDFTTRVLYLDADILCVGQINGLLAINFDDIVAVVVSDAEVTVARRSAALQLPGPQYFNSGVMLINVPRWLEQGISESAMNELFDQRHKDLRFPDQDSLNLALYGRVLYIQRQWNVLYSLIEDLEKGVIRMRPLDDPRLIHFAGAVKPWNDWCLHEARDMFLKYHLMSAWADLPLDPAPQNYKEMRMQSRFLSRRGEYLKSLFWYWRYLNARPTLRPAFLRRLLAQRA